MVREDKFSFILVQGRGQPQDKLQQLQLVMRIVMAMGIMGMPTGMLGVQQHIPRHRLVGMMLSGCFGLIGMEEFIGGHGRGYSIQKF
jgi:hypothetical protein